MVTDRQVRRMRMLVTAGQTLTMAAAKAGIHPATVGRQVRTLMDGTFVDRKENLLAFGTVGGGKPRPTQYPSRDADMRRPRHRL